MVDSIDIRKLTLDELAGVVTLYPWYGGARKELCKRMASMGDAWEEEQFAAASLYLPSRRVVSDLVRQKSEASDYADKDISALLKSYLGDQQEEEPETAPERQIYVVGGDYFTKSQYEKVRRSSDNIFSSFATKARAEMKQDSAAEEEFDFCTEPLAQIYLEQGYPAEAVKIYSKLSLRYPEKSVYFATLIEKIEEIQRI